jgi:hypothetical protein
MPNQSDISKSYTQICIAYRAGINCFWSLTHDTKSAPTHIIKKPVVFQRELAQFTPEQKNYLQGCEINYKTLQQMWRTRYIHQHPAAHELVSALKAMRHVFQSDELKTHLDMYVDQYFLDGNAKDLQEKITKEAEKHPEIKAECLKWFEPFFSYLAQSSAHTFVRLKKEVEQLVSDEKAEKPNIFKAS